MLDHCYNILDLRDEARRRLPSPIFAFLDGGSETERTYRRNTAAFDDVTITPRSLVDVAQVRTATHVLGQDIEWPVYCSPTGLSRLFCVDGELAVARAAARAGTLYSLSTASTHSIEQVAAVGDGPKLFQLYVCKDRGLTRMLVERAKRAGYHVLCVTALPVSGNCERELRTGVFDKPWYRWPLSSVLGFARHPGWVLKQLLKGELGFANIESANGGTAGLDFFTDQLDPSITWKDIRQIADWWGGDPLAVKGLLSADDARRAVDVGATAVVVSNHGGRQLDGGVATFDALPEIARAVGDRIDVILDGGVRRGVHILKALACGAKACSIGRPYLYGLAAGGEYGVAKALSILRCELELAMKIAGCPDIESINQDLITRVSRLHRSVGVS